MRQFAKRFFGSIGVDGHRLSVGGNILLSYFNFFETVANVSLFSVSLALLKDRSPFLSVLLLRGECPSEN